MVSFLSQHRLRKTSYLRNLRLFCGFLSVIYLTEAITIHKEDYKENDLLVSFYTKGFGKIKLRAVGVKKINAKLQRITQLFSYSIIRFFMKNLTLPGRLIGGIFIENKFLEPKLNNIWNAFYVCEVVNHLTPQLDKNKNKFDLILNTLNRISEESSILPRIEFTINFLELAGYSFFNSPEWDQLSQQQKKYFQNNTNLQESEKIISNYLKKYLPYELKTLKFFNSTNDYISKLN